MKRIYNISNDLWSKAFKAYKEGKEPIDLVIEGILTPDEAKYTYEKYLEMVKNFKSVVKPELTNEMWSSAFKAFREGKKPMDLVLEGIMGPEEANYAYEKYIELTRIRKSKGFEIPDSLIALFIAGSFLTFIEALLLRSTALDDPLYNLLLLKLTKDGAVIMNSILSVVALMALVLLSAYAIKNEKIATIPPLLFCIYKLAVMVGTLMGI